MKDAKEASRVVVQLNPTYYCMDLWGGKIRLQIRLVEFNKVFLLRCLSAMRVLYSLAQCGRFLFSSIK